MFGVTVVMNPRERFGVVKGIWGGKAPDWSISSGQTSMTFELMLSWRYDGHRLAVT
jgi:hypothetical protein